MLSEALSNEAHDVTAIGKGEEAVQIALDLKPDIMVLDINIPGSRGDEIARRVRKETGTDIPILFITGNNEFELPDWKNVDLIRKPFELDELIQRVNAFFFDLNANEIQLGKIWGHRDPSGLRLSNCSAQAAHASQSFINKTRSLEPTN